VQIAEQEILVVAARRLLFIVVELRRMLSLHHSCMMLRTCSSQ